MNLFRSEEHARRWTEFDPAMESTLQPLTFWADVFAAEVFRERTRPDYITWLTSDAGRAAFASLRASLPH